MNVYYEVRDILCHFIVYSTALLEEAKKYVNSQDEPYLYEIIDIRNNRKVIY